MSKSSHKQGAGMYYQCEHPLPELHEHKLKMDELYGPMPKDEDEDKGDEK